MSEYLPEGPTRDTLDAAVEVLEERAPAPPPPPGQKPTPTPDPHAEAVALAGELMEAALNYLNGLIDNPDWEFAVVVRGRE